MSPERLGYFLLGIFLAAAGVYVGLVALRQKPPQSPTQTEAGAGETPLPSQSELDAILATLPTNGPFDPATIDWVSYTDGQDGFSIDRPRGWDVADSALPQKPEYRRISLSQETAALSIFPRGEFDVGLPLRVPAETPLLVSGKAATMKAWDMPDGSWLAIVTLDEKPKNGFRMELSLLRPDPTARAILQEMVKRFSFLSQ